MGPNSEFEYVSVVSVQPSVMSIIRKNVILFNELVQLIEQCYE